MTMQIHRRDFLAASAAAGVGLLAASQLQAAPFKTTLKKALIGSPNEATLSSWKAAGFEGIESGVWNISQAAAEDARKVAERLGMPIHAVLFGWANFNNPTKAKSPATSPTSKRR